MRLMRRPGLVRNCARGPGPIIPVVCCCRRSLTAALDRRAAAYGSRRSPGRQAGSAPLRLARRRIEQLLQTVDSLREPRPFAGERALGAVGCLDARGLLDRACDRHRYLFGLAAQRRLLHALLHLLLLLLLGRERRGDGAAALVLQIGGVLFVDFLLLFRRRIGTGDIEGAVLHEIVIGVTAAGLAAAGEFRVAFGERRRLVFLGRGFLGLVGAFLEINRRAAPPLRLRAQRRQHDASGERGNNKRRWS